MSAFALYETLARVRREVDPARRYTVAQAAALFGVGVGPVKDWIAADLLPATRARLGGPFQVGQWLVLGSDLLALARDRVAEKARAFRRKDSA